MVFYLKRKNKNNILFDLKEIRKIIGEILVLDLIYILFFYFFIFLIYIFIDLFIYSFLSL